jgi:HK97 family phage prohead protease
MNNIYSYKDFAISPTGIKDVDGKKGIVTGYFAHFNNVDGDGDIIRKGAFSKTIRENGPDSAKPRIKHLQNHNTSQPLGRLVHMKEDESGLYYESQIGSHSLGQDFIKMVESGLITEHSIGFKTIKRNQLQDYEGYQKDPSKGWNELIELKLWEGSSLTAWGANELTPITGLKGIEKEKAIELYIQKSEALEKFCRNSTATDETIEMLLIHNKQLTQLLIDATEPANAVQPDEGVLNNIFKKLKVLDDGTRTLEKIGEICGKL